MKENSHFTDEVRVRNILLVLDKYKFFILLVTLAAFCAGFYLYKKQDIVYRSTLTFFVVKDSGQGPSLGGVLGSFGSSFFSSSGSPEDLIFGAVKSRTFVNLLKNDLKLMELPLPENTAPENYLHKISISKGENGIVSFSAEWPSPEVAQKIANYFPTAIEQFNEDVHMMPVKSFIQVVDRAIMETRPFKYPARIFLGIGFIIGLLSSVFLSFIFEFLLFLKEEYVEARRYRSSQA